MAETARIRSSTRHTATGTAAPSRKGSAPGRLPVLGHAIPLRRRPLEFLAGLPAHGDLVEIRLGPQRAYMACHPELVRQILLDPRTYDKGGPLFDKVRPLVGNGLFSSAWAEHRLQRPLVQPAFHPGRTASYVAMMCEEIDAVLSSWQEGRAIDLGAALHALTVRVTTRTLFSTTISARAVADVQRCLPIILRGIYRRMTAPAGFLELLPTAENRGFEQARKRLHAVIDETVQDCRCSGADKGDLLSTLVGARDEASGDRFTDDDLRDQVMTLLIAGTETTASVVAWSLHLLSRHPEAERQLHNEADRVLEGRLPAFADLPALGHARRVVTETLRLYPPAWLLSRMVTVETELAGERLKPGAIVLYSPYILGRSPGLFPDPGRFDPDRWLPERAASVPRGAMVPFGAGGRKCMGEAFGMAEATLALAAIGTRWHLRPVPGTTIRPKPEASLGTGPLWMTPHPRRFGPDPAGPGRTNP
ncbi:cytochrome P450 [Streptomyces sp. NPDC002889]|uniref:cytochrome P450 n=1 Tax=Streptomyces sp. NPDC002889 TaxID=3364669 RepID=UPI00368B403B